MANFSFPPSWSSVTSRVEKATSHMVNTPDWALNMDICDIANNHPGQAKDVVKTIKKRLQHKNPKVQFNTLTLLETLIKNCGDYVHSQVVERDILQDMIKIVRKGTDVQVRDKVLALLDSWQEAFGGPGGKYPQYYWAYADLKRSGVMFPRRTMDSPPIFTPARQPTTTSSYSSTLDETLTSERGNFSLSEVHKIRNLMEVLDDMLRAVNPHDRESVKDDVIIELVSQCRSNQKRLMELLSETVDEGILRQGLELNDSLQSVLAKHDSIASGTPLPSSFRKHEARPPDEVSKPPIKQKTPVIQPPVKNQRVEDDDDDDEFAQIARRKSKVKQVSSDNTSLFSPDTFSTNYSDVTSEASSSASNALVLLDPPTPVRTHKEDQNMVDLLSLALTTSPSPSHTPSAPPSQPSPLNQYYKPYNDYVAPWAQPAILWGPQPLEQPPPSQYSYNYPVPPSTAPYANLSSSQNLYQYPTYANFNSRNNVSGYNPSPLQQHYGSFGPGVANIPNNTSAQQYSSFGSGLSGANSVPTAAPVSSHVPNYASGTLRSYDSFGSRASNVPTTAAASNQPMNASNSMVKYNSFNTRGNEMPMKGNPSSQKAAAASQKPYYHPDSLFADLIDLSSVTGQKRSTSSGISSQSNINGRI